MIAGNQNFLPLPLDNFAQILTALNNAHTFDELPQIASIGDSIVPKILRLLHVPAANRAVIYRFFATIAFSAGFGATWLNRVIEHLITVLATAPTQQQ